MPGNAACASSGGDISVCRVAGTILWHHPDRLFTMYELLKRWRLPASGAVAAAGKLNVGCLPDFRISVY